MNKNLFKKNKKGFTLIELLVIIAIIGFLASAAVYSLNSAREEAKYNKCRAELSQIAKAAEIKRDELNTYLRDVTGSGCSACSCTPYDEATMNSSSCINRTTLTFERLGFPGALKDPWGDFYLIDENEYEWEANPCRIDHVTSLNCGRLNIPYFICK
jgi:prepilin-type N-terminal cleavage/methylation domain-containing protein